MAEPIQIKELPQEVKGYLSQFDLSLCFTCGTCVGGCPVTGAGPAVWRSPPAP